ncbi:MAG TPA: DUF4260 domain-containing protein [Rhizomicrobium sp.]|nr:DUF4260 domain-containing protein [Rhizomicrobium sp.]
MATAAHTGCVTGGPRVILRLEGFAVFAAAAGLYFHAGFDWRMFAVLFLAPDLSFAAYLFGPRAGAFAYNTAHSSNGAIGLGIAALALNEAAIAAIALIWLAHIGFDRALGYGLKYGAGFGFTHLGRTGRQRKES